ncbi:hypothetical protein HGG82_13105 [Marinomonas sp. M1K-6]|uniref:Uncharacterized protein n=1 Tax=Marinomonas profundi TaxID=2726122 RepID=A0A847R909_9GAMM|nr:hypothetical protein [Marinomonas profundi]NLQ18546.1 hypothetical protein [Marinomonas profundi]UDV04418.1 hypothetical protein J8N69_06610 [Marinomonas profundi]
MTLTPTYSVVLYRPENGTWYESAHDAARSIDPHCIDPHNIDSLSSKSSRLLVLVPDDCLSVSQHALDHVIPRSLLPLAALSYAVETTFSPPESVCFSYQQNVLSTTSAQLTVFACTKDWAEAVCLPFQAAATSCLLMPLSLWENRHTKARSWSYIAQHALSVYQPNQEKRKTALRLWGYLLLASLLIHAAALFYFMAWQQESVLALQERQRALADQMAWQDDQTANAFVASALEMVQGLPSSARLARFEGAASSVTFSVTLPEQALSLLLTAWRQQQPDWRWEVKRDLYHSPSGLNQEGVVDAHISVFKP